MLANGYIVQVWKMNSYLTALPIDPGREPTKLPTNDLLDLLEFGVPLIWQRAMHLHRFNFQEGTIKYFATFCKCLESLLEDTELNSHKKTGSSNKDDDGKKGRNNQSKGKKKCLCDNGKK